MPKPKIYYKDEAEKIHLKEKYPELKATWLKVPDDLRDSDTPIICNNDEPIESCQVGERYIERLIQKEDEE